MDEFTEVSHQSLGSRLMESIKGVAIGVVLFLLAFPVLWWNEGRAVSEAKSLDEGAASVVSIGTDKVDPTNEGKLVHATGVASTSDILKDSDFGVANKAIKLVRTVEMYQWYEKEEKKKEKKLGGGETTKTTYRYLKRWATEPVDSSDFRIPKGHRNPSMAYTSKTQYAQTVTLGAFSLGPTAIKRIEGAALINLSETDLEKVTPVLRKRASIRDGALYIRSNAASKATEDGPNIGDLRIRFKQVQASEVSLVAAQKGSSLQPWTSKEGNDIELLAMGNKKAEAMFATAKQDAATLTWILRLVGFLMMAFGVGMVFKPLVVMADVIPLFGDVLGAGVFFLAMAIALPLSLLTISLAWIAARPLIGGVLLLGFGGSVAAVVAFARKRRAKRAAPAPS